MISKLERRLSEAFHDDAQHARLTHPTAPATSASNLDVDDVRLGVTEDTPHPRHLRRRWLLGAAATIVMLAIGLLAVATVQERDRVQTNTVPPSPAPSTNPAPVAGPVMTAPPETTTPAVIPLAENGLIAFAVRSAESGDEIYVVAPDGTGLRALTSTPDETELAPAWSPDGTRLAFLRNVRRSFSGSGELVVIDPATGVETFAADIPMERISDLVGHLRWSPDGRRIALNLANSPTPALIVVVETQTWTTVSPTVAGWSPDGKWLVLQDELMLLVPTGLLDDTTNLDVDSNVFGVRALPVQPDGDLSWMPDSSAVLVRGDGNSSSVGVATIGDGAYRTLIEDGARASWSPDGRQLAYLRCDQGAFEVWVAAADGTGARMVTTSLIPPIWSPDGTLLIGAGPDGLFTVHPDGTGTTILTPNTLRPVLAAGCVFARNNRVEDGPVWQPLPPAANTGQTTATSATAE